MQSRKQSSNFVFGLGAGILAGAMWGLVFLTPELTRGFLPIQLSAGRYLAYGVLAAAMVAPAWRRLTATLGWQEWRALIWLSFTGNILYYVCLANGVRGGGVAMTSLVIGLLPVTITLVGSRAHHAVALRRRLPSLVLSAGGLACISWEALARSAPGSLFGLLSAAGALLSWTVYAVGNSRWLARLDHVSAHEWSLLTGVVTGLQALVLAVPAFWLTAGHHAPAEWLRFGAIMAAVALLCSVVGNALWNRACRLLPLTMVGQMIVFETLFALLYGFVWEQRWPSALESLAMVLLVAGVLTCATAHRQPATAEADAEAAA
jgi:drug/metabolite transporter (DMT)-like permease